MCHALNLLNSIYPKHAKPQLTGSVVTLSFDAASHNMPYDLRMIHLF